LMIPYVEGHELGRPLLNSGAFIIKCNRMKELSRDWIKNTSIAEKWIHLNVHPNEMSLSAKILCEGWKWIGLPQWMHFNPIGHFRKGIFPSQELVENCKLPEETFMLHWHKPCWLNHLAKYNPNVKDIISKEDIPLDWWNLPIETYYEHS